jgi:hypothetical protein
MGLEQVLGHLQRLQPLVPGCGPAASRQELGDRLMKPGPHLLFDDPPTLEDDDVSRPFSFCSRARRSRPRRRSLHFMKLTNRPPADWPTEDHGMPAALSFDAGAHRLKVHRRTSRRRDA